MVMVHKMVKNAMSATSKKWTTKTTILATRVAISSCAQMTTIRDTLKSIKKPKRLQMRPILTKDISSNLRITSINYRFWPNKFTKKEKLGLKVTIILILSWKIFYQNKRKIRWILILVHSKITVTTVWKLH